MKDESDVDINHPMLATDQFGNSNEDELSFQHLRTVSTVDLFYDLFIVANLATVTVRGEIADATSMKTNLEFKLCMKLTSNQP